MTFDTEYRAQLGPRPPTRPGVPSAENREWDRRYAALFPSELLPAYHPKWRANKIEPEHSEASNAA